MRMLWLVPGFALVMACHGITVPSDPASQEGIIVERDRPTSFSDDQPTIWVKDALEDECGVIYMISDETDLLLRSSIGRFSRARLGDLEVGVRVRVWTDLILTSCPGQATAEAVEIQEAGS